MFVGHFEFMECRITLDRYLFTNTYTYTPPYLQLTMTPNTDTTLGAWCPLNICLENKYLCWEILLQLVVISHWLITYCDVTSLVTNQCMMGDYHSNVVG